MLALVESLLSKFAPSPTAEVGVSPIAESSGDAPASTSTTEVLAVGDSTTGSIQTVGDHDWYRVTLTAGQSYLFTMNMTGATPLEDPYLNLRDANGAILTWNDDGGPGRNASLRFTPTVSGVYYIDAASWDDQYTGGYQLSLAAVAPQDPLDTIDWGTKLSSNQVKIYFATTGEKWLDATADRSWTTAEKAALFAAAATWSAVTNVSFVEVGSAAQATMVLVLDSGLDGAIGWMTTPPTLPNVGAFDPSGPWWTTSGALGPGGGGFQAMIHELGHALGLAHPHDDGGASEVMEGVTDEFDSYGVAGLNQGVFTVMSYNDGYPSDRPALTSYARGAEATPMALDIAVIQQKYGAVAHNAGDTVYDIGQVSTSSLAYFLGIWDTGGVDTIAYGGASDVVIDLRPATLLNTAGGGGYVSGRLDMEAGFTIAAGVAIENASAGSGHDQLTGNDLDNRLVAGAGNDAVDGKGGNDVLEGGDGDDVLRGGIGSDVLYGQAGNDMLNGKGFDVDSARDFLFGGAGNDIYIVSSTLSGELDVVYEGGGNPDIAAAAGDVDTIHDWGQFFWDFYSVGEFLLIDYAIAGGAYLVGGKDVLNKTITGSAGTDYISTYGHNATIDAGAGTDAISFNLYGLDQSYRGANTVVMRPGSGTDYVYDFLSGTDKIDLRPFNFGITGAQVLAQAVNVDNPGTADDYCYFYLTSAGGVQNFIVFIGLLGSQLQAGDFIT